VNHQHHEPRNRTAGIWFDWINELGLQSGHSTKWSFFKQPWQARYCLSDHT
jgi:hypothetical protein